MNKIESAKTLTIAQLTGILEEKISEHLLQLDEFGFSYKIGCILKSNNVEEMLNNMKRVALELKPVIYAIDKGDPKYGELIRALMDETK